MPLKPMHPAVAAAHKIRAEVKSLLLLADELEASVPATERDQGGCPVFLFGEVKPRRKRKSP